MRLAGFSTCRYPEHSRRAGNFIVKCTVRQITPEWYDVGHRQDILAPALADGLNQNERPPQSATVYSGGAFRAKDALPIKLGAGSNVSLADIVIPLDQLYRVSGSVTSFEDGHSQRWNSRAP